MSGAQRDSVNAGRGANQTEPQERAAGASGRIAIRAAGRTAVGQVRDHNEDNFVVAHLGSGQVRPRDQVFEDEVDDCGLLFAVCDGMGGAAAGEAAGRAVSAVEKAGGRINDSAQPDGAGRGMASTPTASVLVDKVLFLAEVGDSRAYLLRRGQLKQITKDQSLVNQLIEAGHLTE